MMTVPSFSLLNWQEDLPRRDRPAKARQAGDVPMATGRSTGKVSVYHILSRFLPFLGTIADIQIKLNSIFTHQSNQ